MEEKGVFEYSLKRGQKVKTFPTKTSDNSSSKGEAAFISDLLIQRLGDGDYKEPELRE